MKAAVLFATIAALAIVAGAFSAARQQAERDAWRVESGRLRAEIAALERRVDDGRSRRQPQSQPSDGRVQALNDARARLSMIEAEILENRAALVQLKSDRLVAEEYARSSLETLRRQVRKTTEIEQDLAVLQSRRLQIRNHIDSAEEKTKELAGIISTRQEYATSLDQRIAELVIRQEVASSRLGLTEQEEALRLAALESLEAVKASPVEAEPPARTVEAAAVEPEPKLRAETAVSAAGAPVVEAPVVETPVNEGADLDQDRSKGLYRFKNLSVEPGLGGPAVGAGDETEVAARTDDAKTDRTASDEWASKQYDLGRALVTRGERNSGTRELNEAVLAFRAALGEWPKDRDALRWAVTQSDLGYALALLGQRQRDVGVLEEAAIACRGALAEIVQDRTPLLWATAHYNLGLTLSGMATIRDDEILWQNAIEALQQSVDVFEGAGAGAEASKATRRLQDAHTQLTALKNSS